ncbi:M50 family metallopeptidase [Bacillus suaedae]|nr:M50 family metallopeptidase [Bacillus suaedae]
MIQAKLSHLINMNNLFSKIKINPLFWLVVGIGVMTGYFKEVLMVFTIVFIHEMGHAFAANFFNWRINKIELLPFGGVAEVDDTGNRPFHEEVIVILAGPFQHLWMMLLSYLMMNFSFWSLYDHQLFIWHNLMILGFNLIPVLPLDGGRLLQMWFTYRYPYVQALTIGRYASCIGLISLVVLSFIYLPFHLNLWIVLSFLIISNYLEWKQRHYKFMRFLMARRSMEMNVPYLKESLLPVRDSLTLKEVMKKCRRGYRHSFKIFHTKQATTSMVEEKELLELLFTKNDLKAPLSRFGFTDSRNHR